MLRLNAPAFLQITEVFSKIEQAITSIRNHTGARTENANIYDLGEELIKTLRDNVMVLLENSKLLGLTFTILSVERLKEKLSDKNVQTTNLQTLLDFLRNIYARLNDEMGARMCFIISCGKDEFYDQKESIFGAKFANKFPKLLEDAVEAGNCFSLGRNTACVFHLMRVMEGGLQEWGTKLGVAFAYDKNWQNILDEANKRIKSFSQRDANTKKHAAISSNLYNVKLAWRNEVMHPKETYTEEETEKILDAVKSFVLELADIL